MKQPNPMEEVNTLHAILAGILLNGYIQGEIGNKLKDGVLDKAKEEIEKVFTPNSQAISKEDVEIEIQKILEPYFIQHDGGNYDDQNELIIKISIDIAKLLSKPKEDKE